MLANSNGTVMGFGVYGGDEGRRVVEHKRELTIIFIVKHISKCHINHLLSIYSLVVLKMQLTRLGECSRYRLTYIGNFIKDERTKFTRPKQCQKSFRNLRTTF